MHIQRIILLTLFVAIHCPAISDAQTCSEPANERCDGADEFTFADLPLTIEGSLGCENNMVDRPYFDLWYRYDCTVAGDYRIDMCGSTGDTYMRIYADGCGFFSATSWVEDDDSCPGSPNTLDPMITTNLEAGRSYWIEIGAWRVDEAFPPNANDPFILNVAFLGVCRADLNSDGVADSIDVKIFLSLFTSSDSEADFTDDGNLDFFDISAFLHEFRDRCQ